MTTRSSSSVKPLDRDLLTSGSFEVCQNTADFPPAQRQAVAAGTVQCRCSEKEYTMPSGLAASKPAVMVQGTTQSPSGTSAEPPVSRKRTMYPPLDANR